MRRQALPPIAEAFAGRDQPSTICITGSEIAVVPTRRCWRDCLPQWNYFAHKKPSIG